MSMSMQSFRIADKVFLSLLGLSPSKLSKGNGDLISNASRISELKRIDLHERLQVRKEIELLGKVMHKKSQSMTNFFPAKPLTPFSQYELLKDENKKAIRRKASLVKKNNLQKKGDDIYFFKIKKIETMRKINHFPLNASSALQMNTIKTNRPITCNHLFIKGKRIYYNKKNIIDSFLASKIPFNNKPRVHQSALLFNRKGCNVSSTRLLSI